MNVMREGGRVWIAGIEGFSPAECASSSHGCQACILEGLGEALTYDDLLCYSGFAFRIAWHEQGCPSAGHPCCGFACVENANRALPWQTTRYECFPPGKPQGEREAFEAKACAAIKESIDRGVPVHYGSEEDGLIIGYADDGRRWWCVHPYHKWGSEAFWYDEAGGFAGGKWPWGIAVWTAPKADAKRVPHRDLTEAALQQAVDMWNAEKCGAYYVGDAAYTHWLGWLRDVDSGAVENPMAGMQGNGWCLDVLIHNRRIAGRWLEKNAGTFDGDAGRHLEAAAGHYAQIAELCMEDIGCPWDLAPAPERFEQWTGAMRQDQIARLEAACDCDRAAVAAIEKALESIH